MIIIYLTPQCHLKRFIYILGRNQRVEKLVRGKRSVPVAKNALNYETAYDDPDEDDDNEADVSRSQTDDLEDIIFEVTLEIRCLLG